ncbi:hypothetical protein [Gryllotalpicola koreensis]|uniref:Uncharacterized protein n=1 Tax=Gryllotalpicola koreensis TaxID=993086 RepID=A0ABP8A2P5_9MICO
MVNLAPVVSISPGTGKHVSRFPADLTWLTARVGLDRSTFDPNIHAGVTGAQIPRRKRPAHRKGNHARLA